MNATKINKRLCNLFKDPKMKSEKEISSLTIEELSQYLAFRSYYKSDANQTFELAGENFEEAWWLFKQTPAYQEFLLLRDKVEKLKVFL